MTSSLRPARLATTRPQLRMSWMRSPGSGLAMRWA
jgi:hypothetical protein